MLRVSIVRKCFQSVFEGGGGAETIYGFRFCHCEYGETAETRPKSWVCVMQRGVFVDT